MHLVFKVSPVHAEHAHPWISQTMMIASAATTKEEAFMGNKEGSFQLEGEMLPLEEDRPNRLQARVFPLFSNYRRRQEGERKGEGSRTRWRNERVRE